MGYAAEVVALRRARRDVAACLIACTKKSDEIYSLAYSTVGSETKLGRRKGFVHKFPLLCHLPSSLDQSP